MMNALTGIKVLHFLLYVLILIFFALKIHANQDEAPPPAFNISDFLDKFGKDYEDVGVVIEEEKRKDIFEDLIIKNVNVTELEEFDVEILPQDGMKENDIIKRLPGQPCPRNFFQKLLFFINWECSEFKQYGGYVTVNKQAQRAFYYYFVEVSNPSIKDNAPLILWLNGGPGCSSIGLGAFSEIGPFKVNTDGTTLYENIFAWNQVANILFLDSPVGVGYSYSNTTSDRLNSDDEKTAIDSYTFLLNWLERFPEYKNKDFYMVGESYAGHYISQLATVILAKNNNKPTTIINLKGIGLGNPSLDDKTEEGGKFEYYFNHGLITITDINMIRKSCDFSLDLMDRPKECSDPISRVQDFIESGVIFLDNMYSPTCTRRGFTEKPTEIFLKSYDPCSPEYVSNYLNIPEIIIPMHGNYSLPYAWLACRNELNYVDESTPSSMLSLLQNIMKSGIRVLIYSGDYDGIIPISSTLKVLEKLNLTEKIPWTPWSFNSQIAGYSTVYNEGLTFTTIRGAANKVPSFQPEISLVMIKSFLKQETFPTIRIIQ